MPRDESELWYWEEAEAVRADWAPARCSHCGAIVASSEELCAECAAEVEED